MIINENNIEKLILEDSKTKAVFVYFYVNAPELDKVNQAVRTSISDDNQYLSLAEADVSTQIGQTIAVQLGLSSVPALVVFKNGRATRDFLQGDDVAAKLPELIKKYMPSESELLLKQAREDDAAGKTADALVKAAGAWKADAKNLAARLFYARLCIKNRNLEQAHTLLDNAGRELQAQKEYQELLSALSIAEQAQDTPHIHELQEALKKHPNDIKTSCDLAAALSEAGRRKEALELLFEFLKHDLNCTEIKKTFIDILNTMAGDPLQKEFRRKLYTLMY